VKVVRRSFSESGQPIGFAADWCGAIAQLGERLLCKQEVVGSIPSGSTRRVAGFTAYRLCYAASSKKLVRENINSRALDFYRRARKLSDIVKRRSTRVQRVT
jgi:hypothetical protein